VEPGPSDFGVPIYLNQRIVFDLLAMMEDGFSEFRDETSSNSETATRQHSMEAGVSANNLLQIIGLAFKGGGRRDTGTEDASADQVTQRRFHTPASLSTSSATVLVTGTIPLLRR
jgi:hypothetical protein